MTRQFQWSGLLSIIGGLVLPFAFLLHPIHAPNPFYMRVHIMISAG